MSDLISRQDAIRLAEQGQIQGFEWQFKKLCDLPSAEPEITHCYDCVHYTGKDHPWGVCKIHKGAVTNKNRLCQGIDYCSWAERRENE